MSASNHYAHLTNSELATHIAHQRAWARRNPVLASGDGTQATQLREMVAERDRRAGRQPVATKTAECTHLSPVDRQTIDLTIRTLGDLLRTGDLDPEGTSYGVVADLAVDLRGLLERAQ